MVSLSASKCTDVCKLDVSGPNFDDGNIRKAPAVVGPIYCPSNADAGNKSHARSFIWGIAPYFIKPIYHWAPESMGCREKPCQHRGTQGEYHQLVLVRAERSTEAGIDQNICHTLTV